MEYTMKKRTCNFDETGIFVMITMISAMYVAYNLAAATNEQMFILMIFPLFYAFAVVYMIVFAVAELIAGR